MRPDRAQVSVLAVLVVLALVAGALLAGCFRDGAVDGGTETETTLAGRVTDSLGRPAAEAEVVLLPRDFNPVRPSSVPARRVTDREGRYTFADIQAGEYNIQVDGSGTQAALIRGIHVEPPPTAHDSTVKVMDGVLRPSGRILIPWEILPYENGWVYLPGTTVSARLLPAGGNEEGFLLTGVPAGAYAELRATSGETLGENLLDDSLVIDPGETAVSPPYAAWSHSRRLVLAVSEAGLAGEVTGYPLLLRLDASNFDFSQAAPDGSDIRFTGMGGRPLPYQIERWDAAARRAEVWIRADTLRGDGRDQVLGFHFGRAGAATRSDGSAVFGAAEGFAGAWHLAENSPGTGHAGAHRDAGPHGHHGDDEADAAGRDGVAGFGQRFDGVDDFIDLPESRRFLASENQPFTLSAWIWADTSDWLTGSPWPRDSRVLDIHRSDTNGSTVALGVGYGQKAFFYNHKDKGTYAAPDTLSLRQWHLLALSYDGRTLRMYVDGLPAGPAVEIGVLAGGSFHATIGKYGESTIRAFPGAIDEARIAATGRSADWMRLDFASQKPGSALIRIEP